MLFVFSAHELQAWISREQYREPHLNITTSDLYFTIPNTIDLSHERLGSSPFFPHKHREKWDRTIMRCV